MNDEFYKEILEENKEAVKNKIREAMFDGIKRQFEWELPNAVKEEVQKFIKEEITPSIREDLLQNKDAMVEAATNMIAGIPAEIGKKLQEDLAVNLKNSYKLRKITEALFN